MLIAYQNVTPLLSSASAPIFIEED